jgi:hypothetical protein
MRVARIGGRPETDPDELLLHVLSRRIGYCCDDGVYVGRDSGVAKRRIGLQYRGNRPADEDDALPEVAQRPGYRDQSLKARMRRHRTHPAAA